MKKNKTTAAHVFSVIRGFVRMGATIPQIVRLLGVSTLDVEEVIIEGKLSVNVDTQPQKEVLYGHFTKGNNLKLGIACFDKAGKITEVLKIN